MCSSPAEGELTSLPDNLNTYTQTSPAGAQESSVIIARPIPPSSAVAIAPVPTIVVSEVEEKESWWTKHKKDIVSSATLDRPPSISVAPGSPLSLSTPVT
jgi:hypothetical protein